MRRKTITLMSIGGLLVVAAACSNTDGLDSVGVIRAASGTITTGVETDTTGDVTEADGPKPTGDGAAHACSGEVSNLANVSAAGTVAMHEAMRPNAGDTAAFWGKQGPTEGTTTVIDGAHVTSSVTGCGYNWDSSGTMNVFGE